MQFRGSFVHFGGVAFQVRGLRSAYPKLWDTARVFLGESKSTLFGLPKVDAIRNHYYLQQNSNAFYGRPFREPRRGGNSDFVLNLNSEF